MVQVVDENWFGDIVVSKINCKHICKLLYKVIQLEYKNTEGQQFEW